MTADDRVLIAQLSDLHVGVTGRDRDPDDRLAAVVAAVVALDPAPDAVLVTGDLAQNGRRHEYERVRELLGPLRMPIHVLPGNHDDPAVLRSVFPPADGDAMDGFVQFTAEAGGVRLIVCDTHEPGTDGGRLCDQRLAWLGRALAADRSTPTIVAMHHPPLHTGIAAMDEIGLDASTRSALDGLLAAAHNVLRVCAGHVHRAIYATAAGRAVFTCPSTDIAIALDLAAAAALAVVDEPPAFALHVVTNTGATTHVQPVT
jgi:3',5'-cyclic AMP phosphodiesterase CpdA